MLASTPAYEEILTFWFGRVEETIVPTEHRAKIWFGEDEAVDEEIKSRFDKELRDAVDGHLSHWAKTPRGELALILMLDQFSRHIYRGSPLAFAHDDLALSVCLNGLRQESDHHLSLIERVFFYYPLLHSEKLGHQDQAIRCYRVLSELAFSETRVIFDSFLKFANHHYSIIQEFGRFPQRNEILDRLSSPAELTYLKEIDMV